MSTLTTITTRQPRLHKLDHKLDPFHLKLKSRNMSSTAELTAKVVGYVEDYMNQFDGSHDYAHIKRVVGLSHCLHKELLATEPSAPSLDPTVITLGALLHDVGDRKYLLPGQDAETLVQTLLISFGAAPELAEKVQKICSGVSYSSEMKDTQKVVELIKRYPELAVVQDADRLDAIGALGIGRVFTFGGAKVGRGLQDSMALFEMKLFKLEECMKTGPGKRLARERTERLRDFRKWWDEENQVDEIGEEVLDLKLLEEPITPQHKI